MNRLHLISSKIAGILALAAVAGCGAVPKHHVPVGSAVLGVSISALSSANVNSVSVTITFNGGGLPPIVQSLQQTAQGWTGVIGEIPAGSEHFQVDAGIFEARWMHDQVALVVD